MKKYLVERTVKLSKVVEANSKQEAIEWFGDIDCDQLVVRETAKLVKDDSNIIPQITDTQRTQTEIKKAKYNTKNYFDK